ncbi:UNKNOWN [Stylonychia lemnae]|uniref:Uncharacterized protein n=1 Tax=Stylonychia lemnae TaxID=5949 RepID=A0A077ZPF4_STYLE|nr:UNKNOWN [Stylonychia lemnae]|eukprot:CDW71314.1 UNKNOWN [Stylonychia lemnae]
MTHQVTINSQQNKRISISDKTISNQNSEIDDNEQLNLEGNGDDDEVSEIPQFPPYLNFQSNPANKSVPQQAQLIKIKEDQKEVIDQNKINCLDKIQQHQNDSVIQLKSLIKTKQEEPKYIEQQKNTTILQTDNLSNKNNSQQSCQNQEIQDNQIQETIISEIPQSKQDNTNQIPDLIDHLKQSIQNQNVNMNQICEFPTDKIINKRNRKQIQKLQQQYSKNQANLHQNDQNNQYPKPTKLGKNQRVCFQPTQLMETQSKQATQNLSVPINTNQLLIQNNFETAQNIVQIQNNTKEFSPRYSSQGMQKDHALNVQQKAVILNQFSTIIWAIKARLKIAFYSTIMKFTLIYTMKHSK